LETNVKDIWRGCIPLGVPPLKVEIFVVNTVFKNYTSSSISAKRKRQIGKYRKEETEGRYIGGETEGKR
jgi:hypothetical protein